MKLKTLYKLNTNGSTQVWSIHIGVHSHWTVTGKLGGKMITSAPTAVLPKSNRTLEQQVLSEANSKINKKLRKKYVDNVEDIHTADANLPGYTAMLAHNYDKHKAKIVFPAYAQPKLDGVRCLATREGMFSRGRKQFTSCWHIQEELDIFFESNAEVDTKLDGELYTHEFKSQFEKIISAVRKTAEKTTEKDLELQQKMEYWVYDAPSLGGIYDETHYFGDRFYEASIMIEPEGFEHIRIVPTVIVKNEKELIKLKEKWIQEGFEGAIVRNIRSPYEGKRSFNLQKLKDFEDAEFKIVGMVEGKGKLAGHAGKFIFELGDGSGLTFEAKLSGSFERLRILFEDHSLWKGEWGTVRYQGKLASGRPRFGVCVSIRNYE